MMRRRVLRVLVAVIAGLLLLGLAGAVSQAVATSRDRRAYPPPGEMIKVAGHRLHLHCTGHGSPTVILEAGNLGMSAHWVRIQQEVARVTRVCSYDRAGMGWSDAAPGSRDARQISTELHSLLTGAGETGPYVLVGHSYGGLYALTYAGQFPAEVAGLVLLDSSHPDQFTRTPEGQAMFRRTSRMGVVLPWLARLGIVRLTHFLPAHPELPPQQRAEVTAFNSSTRQVATSAKEFRATPVTCTQASATRSLGSKPLAVITASDQPPDWIQMQKELAGLSSNSTHMIAAGTTHASLLFSQRDAALSSAAIAQVIMSVRAGQPLNH
jgi:pimeloyl-ACP methyl ester carboxylesterase